MNRTFAVSTFTNTSLSREAILTYSSRRRGLSATTRTPYPSKPSQPHRADFGQGFTSTYEPRKPTEGPLAKAAIHGAPRLTPARLKEYLDKFVVGQDKAKKVTSVAIFNHYQRIREIKRLDAEEQERDEKRARNERYEKERRARTVLFEKEGGSNPVESQSPQFIDRSGLI